MKRILLLFFALIVATMSLDEDYVYSFASTLSMARDMVLTCVNNTNITVGDIMHLDEVMQNSNPQTDFDDTATKVGCFFSCLLQKKEMMTSAHMNLDKMKEIVAPMFQGRKPEELHLRFQVLETCVERVKDELNECKLSLRFMACLVDEVRKVKE